MEKEFIELVEALLGLFRHALMRCFFFKFVNANYESSVFRATLASEPFENKDQPTKALSIEEKADYAILEAKELWVRYGKVIKSKKKADTNSTVALEGKIDAIVQEDMLSQYKIIKSAYENKFESSILKTIEAHKTEEEAKMCFLENLRNKFKKKIPICGIDKKVCRQQAVGVVCREAQNIIQDDDTLKCFNQLILIESPRYTDAQAVQLYKAKCILEWINSSLLSCSPDQINNFNKIKASIFQLLNYDSDLIIPHDFFKGEKVILSELKQNPSLETIIDHQIFDFWRAKAEILKFWKINQSKITSIDGLKIMHALSSDRGASICKLSN
ncbi:unnamed protein product [Blepharisma stoltei]|uniref:Uncharacterized protein n=1 Tax=Blepharisma stoltei TaxID=1481888 RepID=A0AAU9JA26_9CILI|nr:unnamed protein product [Blepharisma stoltei]